MGAIILEKKFENNGYVRAKFLPDQGMNLASLIVNGYEVIDQSTRPLFEERLSGLGPIIGPHFYHRKEKNIPHIADASVFPHIAHLKKEALKDPFSHGIGRYVEWNYFSTETTITGHLSGQDTHRGIALSSIEGFDFTMGFKGNLIHNGIEIELHAESKIVPSIVGLHYYLALDNKKGIVKMLSKDEYNDMGVWKKIPERWKGPNSYLCFNLEEESDYGFIPQSADFSGKAVLEMPSVNVQVSYKANSDENAFQLYHPLNASFVCIEPVSAKNPREAKQYKNHLKVRIEVLCNQ